MKLRSDARRPGRKTRSGHALSLLAVLLPAILGLLVLTVDAGLLMSESRNVQQATDAAATAAARDLCRGESKSTAIATASAFVKQHNGFADAQVTVNIPPSAGPHAAMTGYAEVIVESPAANVFQRVFGSAATPVVRGRAVAGAEAATAGAAVVVLDPSPSQVTVSLAPLALLTLPPPDLAGLEIIGLGTVKIDGAVLVNTEWRGVDENGETVGTAQGLAHAVTCTPALPLTRLRTRDLRVAGGVDNPTNYKAFASGGSPPLQANRLPVPDPYKELPVPTTGADPSNVSSTNYGGVSVTGLPLIGPTKHLYPGIYSWIQVVSGKAVFHPGVYVIRGKNPLTQLSLSIAAGQVTADGVMFYITDSAAYSVASGSPDASDGETEPAAPGALTLVPSVVISTALLGSQISPLNSPGSPFNGILIYQRRFDRRPIIVVGEDLLGSNHFAGTIYAKWGQVMFAGQGTYDVRIVAGTLRFVDVLNCTIQPTTLLPPARDVYLVE